MTTATPIRGAGLLAALAIAGLVHIGTLVTVPRWVPETAVTRLMRTLPPDRFTVIAATGGVLRGLDPAFVHAACPLDLAAGPVGVTGPVPDDLWTLALVDTSGAVVADIAAPAVDGGRLALEVGTAGDLEIRRRARGGLTPAPLTATLSDRRGLVLVRAFLDEGADRPALEATLAALACTPLR